MQLYAVNIADKNTDIGASDLNSRHKTPSIKVFDTDIGVHTNTDQPMIKSTVSCLNPSPITEYFC